MSEINEGVRILVERMKTNPEEFNDGVLSRWAESVRMAQNAAWLTSEERKMLDDAANQVQRDAFTARVLKALTGEDDKRGWEYPQEPKKVYLNPAQVNIAKHLIGAGGSGGLLTTTGGSNGTTWTSGATTSSNTGISSPVVTQAELEHKLAEYARAIKGDQP